MFLGVLSRCVRLAPWSWVVLSAVAAAQPMPAQEPIRLMPQPVSDHARVRTRGFAQPVRGRGVPARGNEHGGRGRHVGRLPGLFPGRLDARRRRPSHSTPLYVPWRCPRQPERRADPHHRHRLATGHPDDPAREAAALRVRGREPGVHAGRPETARSRDRGLARGERPSRVRVPCDGLRRHDRPGLAADRLGEAGRLETSRVLAQRRDVRRADARGRPRLGHRDGP